MDGRSALEKLVVNNDDLSELEQRIGRFNVFDALRIAQAEIRHSNFLAWLLDPAESHGQSALFLSAFLMDVLSVAPPDSRPYSPVDIDGAELRGVEVRREWRNIDLLILCREPEFVIAIENKVRSGEHGEQLKGYRETVEKRFPELYRSGRAMFVYLTVDGSEASEPDWIPYSYADIHRALDRCRRVHERSIGDDVLAFLDHYLRLIGSRFMDDPKIDELCKRIYRNHRQALELIFERCVVGGSPLIAAIAEWLNDDPVGWHVFYQSSHNVRFVPAEWLDWLPPFGNHPKWDPRGWLALLVDIKMDPGACYLRCGVGPCEDVGRRREAIRCLAGAGLGSEKKKVTDVWTTLHREKILSWPAGEEPDVEKLLSTLKESLGRLRPKLSDVHDALRPVIERSGA